MNLYTINQSNTLQYIYITDLHVSLSRHVHPRLPCVVRLVERLFYANNLSLSYKAQDGCRKNTMNNKYSCHHQILPSEEGEET